MLCKARVVKNEQNSKGVEHIFAGALYMYVSGKKISSTATWTCSLRGGCTSILKEFNQGVKRCCHLIQSRQ